MLPVKLDKIIKYYIKIESPNIDMITFSDYVRLCKRNSRYNNYGRDWPTNWMI